MYMKTKELGCKETQGIRNIGIEDSQGNRIVDQTQVLKIWENYITELCDRPNRPETLEFEPEEEADTDEKGPYIFPNEVEKTIKEMRNKKAKGDDDDDDDDVVPADLLKLLGEGGLKIMTKLINTIWIRDFETQLKSQSSQWKHATSPNPKKCRRQKSKFKRMMTVAYDKNGVIVPLGSTVTAAFYRKSLQDALLPKIRQTCPAYSQPVSSFCTITRGLMPQVQYRKFWKSLDGKYFPTRRTVLT